MHDTSAPPAARQAGVADRSDARRDMERITTFVKELGEMRAAGAITLDLYSVSVFIALTSAGLIAASEGHPEGGVATMALGLSRLLE